MDVNGTRYHLLLGSSDWERCQDEWGTPLFVGSPPDYLSLAWDKVRNELTLKPKQFIFKAAKNDTPPRLEQRRGAARDRFGNWYWIAESETEIRVFSSGSGKASHFWEEADRAACEPEMLSGAFHPIASAVAPTPQHYSGLCVTEDHYLVVGVSSRPGLLIFDLYGGGPPRELRWPDASFAPFELAPRPEGGVWILDRNNKLLFALDRKFDPVTVSFSPPVSQTLESFQPKNGEARYNELKPVLASTSLNGLDVIALESLSNTEVLLMTRDGKLYHLKCDGVPEELIDATALPKEIKLGHDFAYVPREPEEISGGRILGQVYRLTLEGNQAIAYELIQHNKLELIPLYRYFPVRRFSGKALVAAGGEAYYDFGERWLPLVEQPRPTYEQEGVLLSPIFDGKEPDCVWHRLLIDACIPAEAEVKVYSRSSNDENELETLSSPPDSPLSLSLNNVPWYEEPPLYPRSNGSELPFVTLPAGYNTFELLFQQARGRYLQLRLELSGNGRVTPHLRALRAYYPRFSYMRYLPALYREEDSKQSYMLERYLANLEGFYTALEDKIANAQVLFDPWTAPPETLEWLGRWLGVVLEPTWSEAKRRLFLRYAPLFFRYRGTLRGLLMALRLTLEDCADEDIFTDPNVESYKAWGVRLVEHFRTRLPTLSNSLALSTEQTLLWQRFLAKQYGEISQLNTAYDMKFEDFSQVPVPTTTPAEEPQRSDWQTFMFDYLALIKEQTRLWQDFLARRYREISRFNTAYKADYREFSEVKAPTTTPVYEPQRSDWQTFRQYLLPLSRTAHRFSVLLPVKAGEAGGDAAQQSRLELARRIVELEKPAHTVFDLKFFWALFRVGEARLGQDTRLDQGSSRVPELMKPAVLGQGYLAESYLEYQNAPGRRVLNQDVLE